MESHEAAEHVASDPNIGKSEAEFTISFSKADERANFHSSIRGPSSRALRHTEINIEQVQVYYDENGTYAKMDVQDFDGLGKIVSVVGDVPIGLIKLGNKSRSSSGYANIISTQAEVSFDEDN